MNLNLWEWAKEFPRIDKESITKFAESIGDNNPLHRDNKVATDSGLSGVIAPGLMMMGYLSSAIAEKIPGVMITGIEKLKFCKPLYAGMFPVVCCAKEGGRRRIIKIRFEIRNEDTMEMLAFGRCTLLLPQH